MTKVEAIIRPFKLEAVKLALIEAIQTAARIGEIGEIGEIGDGKIFVSPVDRVVRIRTGDLDRSAI